MRQIDQAGETPALLVQFRQAAPVLAKTPPLMQRKLADRAARAQVEGSCKHAKISTLLRAIYTPYGGHILALKRVITSSKEGPVCHG